ncbi:hypothetical protein, partial [Frankia sp. CiP3]|uniref:hypothetical protein n=1 Tax=Frankia sp. CiP3 TaxID=2880971 RepID=UPI001EF4A037
GRRPSDCGDRGLAPERRVTDFLEDRKVFFLYCLALFRPGWTPPDLPTDRTVAGDVSNWPEDDVAVLIEEGRRHLDRLLLDIDQTRTRAQQAVTATLALLVVVAAQLPGVAKSQMQLTMLAVSGFLLAVGFCGALSITVIQVRVSVIHAGVLSTSATPIRRRLAKDYAEAVIETGRTVHTMLTVLSEAARYVTLGGALDGILWLVRHI